MHISLEVFFYRVIYFLCYVLYIHLFGGKQEEINVSVNNTKKMEPAMKDLETQRLILF